MKSAKWLGALALAVCVSYAVPSHATLIELFDEDPAFRTRLTGVAGGAAATIVTDANKGSAAISITGAGNDNQMYNPNIAGWSYGVVANPTGATQVRWMVLAWKKTAGVNGIMIQFPDNGGWGAVTTPFVTAPAPGTRRYIAGDNVTGWSGIQVATAPPSKWTLVVRDLFADFGAFTLTGVALTPFGGTGVYDSIYLGASQAEVMGAVEGGTAVEPAGKLATTWSSLKYGE
ncbi:MAG: hypothetical protein O3A46_05480 [Candidatus Poribacteria bacterium]|nr:hypothetical protein [Candidatus Poribacteria bacterium]